MVFIKGKLVIKGDPKVFLVSEPINITNMIESLDFWQFMVIFFGYNKEI